jgi:SET family sugar efflux transporter-like MFS transporter
LTSTAFLIVAFLTGIAGALQTPTLSLFLTNEVHVRPAMVGFFLPEAPSSASWSASFWPGVRIEKATAKALSSSAVC